MELSSRSKRGYVIEPANVKQVKKVQFDSTNMKSYIHSCVPSITCLMPAKWCSLIFMY